MKWLTNNFSLNMVTENQDYNLIVKFLTERQFKIESKVATNRLNQMDVCQALNIVPCPGKVTASIGDELFVAQMLNGDLIYKKVIIGEIL